MRLEAIATSLFMFVCSRPSAPSLDEPLTPTSIYLASLLQRLLVEEIPPEAARLAEASAPGPSVSRAWFHQGLPAIHGERLERLRKIKVKLKEILCRSNESRLGLAWVQGFLCGEVWARCPETPADLPWVS